MYLQGLSDAQLNECQDEDKASEAKGQSVILIRL